MPISTTNLAYYGELGRSPLIIKGKILIVKYGLRVADSCDVPLLVKEAYNKAVVIRFYRIPGPLWKRSESFGLKPYASNEGIFT